MTRYLVGLMMIGLLFAPATAAAQCPGGMVASGVTCIDKYEASLWKFSDPVCVRLIREGIELPRHCMDGATQVGINGVDYLDAHCQFNGGGCTNIFALSLPGVIPARSINYFIAAAACRNSRKRLPSNAEWQAAALGTPDPWPQDDPANQCNLHTPSATLTGSRSKCVSDVGAFDMVGNVIEFVADWGPLATTGATWDIFIPGFGNDVSNIGGSPAGTIYGLPGTASRRQLLAGAEQRWDRRTGRRLRHRPEWRAEQHRRRDRRRIPLREMTRRAEPERPRVPGVAQARMGVPANSAGRGGPGSRYNPGC